MVSEEQKRKDRINDAYFRFERFIGDMVDEEFEIWYDEEATEPQQDFADKIRETVSPEETELIFP